MSVAGEVLAFDASATAAEFRGGVEVAAWVAIGSVVTDDDTIVVRVERDDDMELVVTIRRCDGAASGGVAA